MTSDLPTLQTSSAHVTAERVVRAVRLRQAPKREVSPHSLGVDLDEYRRGNMRITRLWEDLRDEDDALSTVISKRKDAVARLRWEILIDEDLDEGKAAEAERHRDVLQGWYSQLRSMDVLMQDDCGGVGQLARQILDAKVHGHAGLEWIWKPRGGRRSYTAAELRRCPPWWFESKTGQLRFLPHDYSTEGVPMDPSGWVVAAAPALMRPSCVLWLYRNLTLRDWLAFSEKFGMPGLLGKTSAEKGSPAWNALRDALAGYGQDLAMVVSEGAQVDTLEVRNAASALPYPPLVEMLTRATYALWLGGDLSTLSAQTGQGQGASLQGNEAEKIEDDDARFVSEICQSRIDRQVIAYEFGEVEPLAYFKLAPPVRQNTAQELQVDEFFAKHGLPVERATLYARYNRPLPAEDSEDLIFTAPPAPALPLGGAPFGNEAPGADGILRAVAADLAPVRERLSRILTIEDPEILRTKLAAFAAELPQLLRDLNADPSAAREFERLLSAGMAKGMTAKAGDPTPSATTP